MVHPNSLYIKSSGSVQQTQPTHPHPHRHKIRHRIASNCAHSEAHDLRKCSHRLDRTMMPLYFSRTHS